MAGLGATVTELLARARAATNAKRSPEVARMATFGSNPGALRMAVHVPAGLPSRSPLVVVLHGCAQTAMGYAADAGWIELADKYGFVLLCPEQTRSNNPGLCFSWFEEGDVRRGSGEAESIAQMIRHVVRAHDADGERVFVTGLSAGGAMTAAMLAAYPDLFAAGAVIAGLPYAVASGVGEAMAAMRRMPELSVRNLGDRVRAAGAPTPVRWPRVDVWRGDADATVTPAAGEALARQWADVHGATECATGEASERRSRRTWLGADGAVAVELHTVMGLGHGTPIAVSGIDGCGSPAPWVLESGISSSREIIRAWRIDTAPWSEPSVRARPIEAPSTGTVAKPKVLSAGNVGETIAIALRSAGLTR